MTGPETMAAAPEWDHDLGALLCRALRTSSYRALHRLRCEVKDGVIVISGALPSYFLKQVAQAILLRHTKDCPINNLIEVH